MTPLWVAIGVLLALCVFVIVAFATESPPSPIEVAFAYETSWLRRDLGAVWDLITPELQNKTRRPRRWIASLDYDEGTVSLVPEIVSEDKAVVEATIHHADSAAETHELTLSRVGARWVVSADSSDREWMLLSGVLLES